MKTTLLALLVVLVAACAACKSPEDPAAAPPADATATPGTPKGEVAPTLKTVQDDIKPPPDKVPAIGERIEPPNEEWKVRLSERQFYILREAGTERATTGAYNKHYETGVYHCSACNSPLFSSKSKFDSGTGWPSFYEAIEDGRIKTRVDDKLGVPRNEILCAVCDGHLGPVFNDGPKPTGDRFCVNSASLYFRGGDL